MSRRRLIPAHAGKTRKPAPRRWSRRAHPRSRGENRYTATYQVTAKGSSPLTRGKRAFTLSCCWSCLAHPRSRGENIPANSAERIDRGSSPLTRGKPAAGPAFGQHPGLIPAHAGKTRAARRTWIARWAHPRSRGENSTMPTDLKVSAGSSPLTRGKRRRERPGHRDRRLIPAHAGKTEGERARYADDGAHPRSRGENFSRPAKRCSLRGSSPLTRGKLALKALDDTRAGLIPAHAGKTSEAIRRSCLIWAHPRSRGENRTGGAGVFVAAGSSPLTRGKLTLDDPGHVMRGLIPAHAGKTFPRGT